MDILAVLKQEEVKFERQMEAARQQLETVRMAIKVYTRDLTDVKPRKKMSAVARAKVRKRQGPDGQNIGQPRQRENNNEAPADHTMEGAEKPCGTT
jgi:hypothetical protein